MTSWGQQARISARVPTALGCLTVVVFFLVSSSLAHECIQDKIQKLHGKPEKISVPYDTNHFDKHTGEERRLRLMQSISNMRIFLDTERIEAGGDPGRNCESVGATYPNTGAGDSGTCTSDDVLSTSQRNFLRNTLLAKAQIMLQDALRVVPVSGNLRFQGRCVGIDAIPTKYLTNGVAADFVIFVTARPTQPGTLAWAAFCKTDDTGRPVVAQINIGPGGIDPALEAKQIMVAVHELTHGLGFASNAYENYLDENGKVRTKVIDTAVVNGKEVTRLVTPSAVFQAQQHFGCSTLTGIEVEDVGGSGSAGSHWEKRIFDNEYMTATASSNMPMSAITLGLLQDTGWYYPDYTKAQPFHWGRQVGCVFTNEKCNRWPATFFCSDPSVASCTVDWTARASCSITQYTSALPTIYQYFTDPTIGGKDQFGDYCPKMTPYSDGDCRIAGNAHSQVDAYGEQFSTDSRCFASSLLSTQYQAQDVQRVACHQTRCSSSGALEVKVGSNWVSCPIGTKITVSGFNGQLTCPTNNIICDPTAGLNSVTPAPSAPVTTPAPTATASASATPTPASTPTSAGTPGAPGIPTCTSGTVIVVKWTAPSSAGDGPITKYTLRHNGGSTNGFTFEAFSGMALEASVANVIADIPIRFTVSASNLKGEGPQSAASAGCTKNAGASSGVQGGNNTGDDDELTISGEWWFYASVIFVACCLGAAIYLLCCRNKNPPRHQQQQAQQQAGHPMQAYPPPHQAHHPQAYPPPQPGYPAQQTYNYDQGGQQPQYSPHYPQQGHYPPQQQQQQQQGY
eukprot:TRINITY_DN1123_c0_g1_i2.p1 TRINITY_DN1123_c0_g1~~TRINITY_DN1123_c0_g1_i2.p1  ORF type:complete len:795 (-),score=173.69 TRINITY_DN1123_c0_g1_i2:85-2469(-)